jgi:O-antigen ligase
MTGTVILVTVLSALMALSIVNRRWLILAILLGGGFPFGLFMPHERFFGLYANGAYLFVILSAIIISFFFVIPDLFSQTLKYSGVFFFLLYCLFSLLWTSDIEWGVRTLVKLVSPFIFFVAAQAFLKREQDLRIASRMIFACCLIVSLLAVVNTLGNGVLAPGEDLYNVRHNYLAAPYMSPANYSFLIGSGAILAFTNLLTTRKLSYLFLSILFTILVFWSFVRISMAGLVAAIGIVFFLLTRNFAVKLVFPVMIFVIFVTCIFTVEKFRSRMFKSDKFGIETVLSTEVNKLDNIIYTSGRSTLWRKAYVEFLQKRPLTGGGIGSVDSWLEKYFNSVRLHSEYLRIASDLGVLGLILFLLSICQFYARLLALYLSNNNPVVRSYTVTALAGLTFYLITFATDNSLNYICEFGLYIYSFMAFAFISAREGEEISAHVCEETLPCANLTPSALK